MINRRQHAAKGIPPFLIKETPTLGVFLFLLKRVKAIFTTKGFSYEKKYRTRLLYFNPNAVAGLAGRNISKLESAVATILKILE